MDPVLRLFSEDEFQLLLRQSIVSFLTDAEIHNPDDPPTAMDSPEVIRLRLLFPQVRIRAPRMSQESKIQILREMDRFEPDGSLYPVCHMPDGSRLRWTAGQCDHCLFAITPRGALYPLKIRLVAEVVKSELDCSSTRVLLRPLRMLDHTAITELLRCASCIGREPILGVDDVVTVHRIGTPRCIYDIVSDSVEQRREIAAGLVAGDIVFANLFVVRRGRRDDSSTWQEWTTVLEYEEIVRMLRV